MNAHLLEGCRKRLADRLRGHDGTIGERLERDLAAFQKPLPAPYEACDKKSGSVNSLSLVRYRLNDYSVPVVITHSSAIFRIDGERAYWVIPFVDQTTPAQLTTLANALFNPGAAVVLFFVLSGYVWAGSFWRATIGFPLKKEIVAYLIKRAFRLLPAMWMSIVVFILVLRHLPTLPTADLFSDWFIAMFGPPARTIKDALLNAVFLDFRANPITWTMYIEVVGSLAVPALVLWHRWTHMPIALLPTCALIALAALPLDSLLTNIYFVLMSAPRSRATRVCVTAGGGRESFSLRRSFCLLSNE